MQMFKLISATPSPYARKVRIALAEKSLPFDLVTEVPWDSGTQTPKYNPLEKLPVLVTEAGEGIYESSYILQWLELKYPEIPLLPHGIDDILLARKLEVLCDGICDAVVLTFFERMRKDTASPEWLARQRRKIEGGVREMAKLVGERTYAVAEKFTLGDIAVGTALGYLRVRFAEFDWMSQYPRLDAYAAQLDMRASFANSAPYPQVIRDKIV